MAVDSVQRYADAKNSQPPRASRSRRPSSTTRNCRSTCGSRTRRSTSGSWILVIERVPLACPAKTRCQREEAAAHRGTGYAPTAANSEDEGATARSPRPALARPPTTVPPERRTCAAHSLRCLRVLVSQTPSGQPSSTVAPPSTAYPTPRLLKQALGSSTRSSAFVRAVRLAPGRAAHTAGALLSEQNDEWLV